MELEQIRKNVDNFLGLKTIAFVGVSSNTKDFSRMAYKEFLKNNYTMVPINPKLGEIDGTPVVGSVKDAEAVDGVFIMTPAQASAGIVNECIDLGIKNIWLHRGVGQGSVSEEALRLCAENGINVVPGYCPFMFLPTAGFPHSIHRFFLKLTGKFPKEIQVN